MPYIEPKDRLPFLNDLDSLRAKITNEGELNFVISRLISNYVKGRMTYARINTVMGVMDSAKFEFYRRVVVPYEDRKIKENGDI